MKTQDVLKNIDKGFFMEARTQGLTPGGLMVRMAQPEPAEVEPVYKRALMRFEAKDDGSYRSRAIREFAEGVAVLEACFAERGIRRTDRVEKFYSSANDTALFPAFLATEIIAGQLATSLVPRMAAMEERVTSHVAEKVTMADTSDDRTLKFTGEGAAMPKTKITTAEGQTKLYKYGRVLEYTYESARLQALDVIGTFIQRMGIQIGIDETDDLIETLIAGDGTTGSPVTDTDVLVNGVLDFNETLRLKLAFPTGYHGTEGVINDANLLTICNMAEFKDPQGPFGLQRMDEVDRAMVHGMGLNRWTSTGSTAFSTDRILVVDSRYAVKVLQEGDFLEEADRIIDKQLNRRAMSEWKGYQKLDNDATQCLDITL